MGGEVDNSDARRTLMTVMVCIFDRCGAHESLATPIIVDDFMSRSKKIKNEASKFESFDSISATIYIKWRLYF